MYGIVQCQHLLSTRSPSKNKGVGRILITPCLSPLLAFLDLHTALNSVQNVTRKLYKIICYILSSSKYLLTKLTIIMVVLLYSDISNFTFWSVNILKCKNFLIGFLHELGNFKQKKFYTSECKILHFEMSG